MTIRATSTVVIGYCINHWDYFSQPGDAADAGGARAGQLSDPLLQLRAARAGRRLRRDHPVELPARDGRLEAGAGARDGQHLRAQAGVEHSADRAQAGRDPRRDRAARGRRERRSPAAARRSARSSPPIPTSTRSPSPARPSSGGGSCSSPPARSRRRTLELGGKSPNIVFEDADMDQAVDGALWATFFHQGQVCESGTRLLAARVDPRRVRRAPGRAREADQGRRPARLRVRPRAAGLRGAARDGRELRADRQGGGREARARRQAARGRRVRARLLRTSRRSSPRSTTR